MKLGEEPYKFTNHFHGWDFAKRKAPLSFDQGLSSVREALAQYNRKFSYPFYLVYYLFIYICLVV
jgi:hypothetical protein